jgi:hypothetical protein
MNRLRTALAAFTVAAVSTTAAVLAVPQAQAATAVYVSTSGSDSNAGTSAAPYRSLEKAISVAAAGTTIYVRGGTYYPATTLKSQVSGTSSSRITLTAYGSEKVKVDGSHLAAGSWLLAIYANYWTVSNMQFQKSPAQGVVCTSCTGGVFQNVTTNDNGDSGFTLRGDNTVNNLVRNLDSYNNYDRAGHGQNADGVAVKFGSGSGNLITGARLYNNSDDGIDLWSFTSPVTIEHTWAFGNGYNRWGDTAFEGNGNGFKLGGGSGTIAAVAHVVNNSAAWNNKGNGFTENGNRGAIAVNRTTAYGNGGWGYYFATGAARLGKNLAVGNAGGKATTSSSVVSQGNNWDSGIATPPFVSTDATTTYNPRRSDGSLPATTFLTTGSDTIGSTMN